MNCYSWLLTYHCIVANSTHHSSYTIPPTKASLAVTFRMPSVGTSTQEPVEVKSLESCDAERSSYDESSSSEQFLLNHSEDFDVEAQPSQHQPRPGDKLSTTVPTVREIRIREFEARVSAKFADLLGPWQPYVTPVFAALRKLLYFAFCLGLGALALIIVWTILIGISIVVGKLAIVAIWIWKKIGLI